MKDKYKKLIKDLFFFTISTFVPKAISFFLVPLYTGVLSTSEYGIADLLSTIVGLMVPIITLEINNSVLRFTIENKAETRPYQIAFSIVVRGISLVFGVILINLIFGIIKIDWYIQMCFFLNYSFISIYGINIAYLRATDNVKLLSILSVINTFISILSNIILLVVFKSGLLGYMISGFIGYAMMDLYFFKKFLSKNLFRIRIDDKDKMKDMMKYSIPLIAANLAWWVNSSSDRFFISGMLGVSENGVYSVAYKIPTILQMVQSVFSQAWLLSVYREYKDEGGKEYISHVFKLYSALMCIICGILIAVDIPLASFLYKKEFYDAWIFVPYLLISVVCIAYAGFFESLLTLNKKTKYVAGTTVIGALINILLNYILIKHIGTIGAAIATVIGYFFMWALRIRPVMKIVNFKINWLKIMIQFVLLVIETEILLNTRNIMFCSIFAVIIILLNIKEIISLCKMLMKRLGIIT